jgi:hypothetical protein
MRGDINLKYLQFFKYTYYTLYSSPNALTSSHPFYLNLERVLGFSHPSCVNEEIWIFVVSAYVYNEIWNYAYVYKEI